MVLYSDKIDYTALPNLPDYVVHARKPYIPDPLPEFLALGDANVSGHVVSISVHKNSVLIHVPKYMILYALEGARTCTLYLTDNTTIDVDEKIDELRQIFEPYEEFERVNKNSIANFKYVNTVTPVALVMQDNKELKISLLRYREYKWMKQEIDEQA